MKPEIEIAFDSPSGQYLGGSLVQGVVQFTLGTALEVDGIHCRLHGEMHTEWVNKVSDRIYDSLFMLIDETSDLGPYVAQKWGEGRTIPAGNHRIPFQFQLPPTLPSSLFNEYCGWIAYTVTVRVQISPNMQCIPMFRGTTEFEHNQTLSVVTFLNLAHFPNVLEPASRSNSVELTGCFGSEGCVTATVKLERSGFVAGDTVPVGIEILNMTKKKKLKKVPVLILEQSRRFTAENRYERGAFDEKVLNFCISSVDLPPIAGTELFRENISIRIPQDALPTSVHLGQSESEKLISVAYILRLDMDLFDVSLPLIIGNFNQ